MPRVTDYATLTQAIKDTLNRDEFDTHIPMFIQDAESMFNREIRYRGMLVRDEMVLPSTDTAYENLPGDYLELKSLFFDTTPIVVPKYLSPQAMHRFRAQHPGLAGTPLWFSLVGIQILFDRTATGSPKLQISSYVKIPSLNDTTQTSNALLSDASDLYKYGCLMQAEVFLKNDPRLATWTALYQNARDSLPDFQKPRTLGVDSLTVRHKRVF
jgi:hypothetical protein